MKKKGHAISQAAVKLDDNDRIIDDEVVARFNGDTIYVNVKKSIMSMLLQVKLLQLQQVVFRS